MPQAARSSSDITGLTTHGVAAGRRDGSGAATGRAVTGGGPGCTFAAPPGALRQAARSSSLITGFTSHGTARRGTGSTRTCGFTTTGGPGWITLASPTARQLARSSSLITGFTSHGPVRCGTGVGCGGGGTARACGFTTTGAGGGGGAGCTRATPLGAARQLARSCSDITGFTTHGPFALSASAGGGGGTLAGAGFGATLATGGRGATGAARGAATGGCGGW